MAHKVRQTSQGHEICCPWLGGHGFQTLVGSNVGCIILLSKPDLKKYICTLTKPKSTVLLRKNEKNRSALKHRGSKNICSGDIDWVQSCICTTRFVAGLCWPNIYRLHTGYCPRASGDAMLQIESYVCVLELLLKLWFELVYSSFVLHRTFTVIMSEEKFSCNRKKVF